MSLSLISVWNQCNDWKSLFSPKTRNIKATPTAKPSSCSRASPLIPVLATARLARQSRPNNKESRKAWHKAGNKRWKSCVELAPPPAFVLDRAFTKTSARRFKYSVLAWRCTKTVLDRIVISGKSLFQHIPTTLHETPFLNSEPFNHSLLILRAMPCSFQFCSFLATPRLEASPHAAWTQLRQPCGLQGGGAAGGLRGLHQLICTATQPRRALAECHKTHQLQLWRTFIPFQLSAIAKKFAKQFLFGLFASFFLLISLRFKTVVVLTSRCLASRYSKPSAILRMPAVLTIRTKPKLFPICVRTCRNLSKTSWPAPMATAATSKLKLVDFLGKNLETCETLRHVIYCTTDI